MGNIPKEEIPVEHETTVDHCNSRTEYELIRHLYDPENCDECSRIQSVILFGHLGIFR